MRITKFGACVFLRIFANIWPRRSYYVVMGGWSGELFIDNPKYLLLHMLEHTNFHITWVGCKDIINKLPKNDKLSFANKGSLAAFWALINANTWICCQSVASDLTWLPILGRAKSIDLWHGIPVKFIGNLTPKIKNQVVEKSLWWSIYHKIVSNPLGWLVVSNEQMIDILCDGVPSRYSRSKILRVGTPRNDFLINNANNTSLISSLRKKYSDLLGFDISKRIVLYLPTWRMNGDVFAFYRLPEDEQVAWKKMLASENAVLIEKHHWGTYVKYPDIENAKCSLAISSELQKDVDVQELLLITNILISDYSGAYIDFALLKRPVIHFAYDFEEYSNEDSGLAYNLRDVAAGPVVYDVVDLKEKVRQALKKPEFLPAGKFDQLVEYEKGCASSHIVRFISNVANTPIKGYDQ